MVEQLKRVAVLLGIVLLPFGHGIAQQPWQWPDVERIVAIGDVHGAYTELGDVLQAAGVVDDSLTWAGGDTHLVSVGDLLDRGPDSRAVMDLLMRLQDESAAQGGGVHVVLGNHELMNLIGDLRYVAPEEYAAFIDDEPPEAREAALTAFLTDAEHPVDESTGKAQFEQRFPPGYFGHRLAFAPDGRYGAWLLSLPSLVVVNDTAFVHGGLPPLVADSGLADLNERVLDGLQRYLGLRARLASAGILPAHDMQQDAELANDVLEAAATDAPGVDPALLPLLEEFLALGNSADFGIDGPHWYRGSVYCKPILEGPVLDAALEGLGAARVVVGHTPTGDRRVNRLYDGALIMIDTGMLVGYYSGRPAALVIEGDQTFVQYASPPQREAIGSDRRIEAHGLTAAELLEALSQGTVTTSAQSEAGAPRQVELQHNGASISAIFHAEDRDGAANRELAAYGLDRLLGLDLVPPTVPRKIGEQQGALQLRYPNAVTETLRFERQLPFGWCPIEPQVQLMYAFDVLISNLGRTGASVLYRQDLSNLTLVNHGQSFGTQRRLPAGLSDQALTLSPALEAALLALDEESVESALGQWLDSRQLRALLSRRDEIVERF